jgi:hypothetical protein
VSNEVPSGHMSSEPLGFFHKMPSEVPNGYFLYEPPEFFHKILKNAIKLYLVGSLQCTHDELPM